MMSACHLLVHAAATMDGRVACHAEHAAGAGQQQMPQARWPTPEAGRAHLNVHLLRHRPHFGKALRLCAGGCQDLQRKGASWEQQMCCRQRDPCIAAGSCCCSTTSTPAVAQETTL